jgi:hypothetical protein
MTLMVEGTAFNTTRTLPVKFLSTGDGAVWGKCDAQSVTLVAVEGEVEL